MPLMLRYVARSDVGLVREGNEDSGYAGPRLLAVADGMGGHAAGEVASSATIEELVHIENAGSDGDPLEALRTAVKAANDRIKSIVRDDPARHGMGTTLTALLWTGDAVALAHIGDSRAYLLRDGELRQVTHDHTFVQSLVDEGRITPDEATIHPARSMILRALQGDSDPEPDLDRIEVRAGDRFLICSDGLSGVVRDETMRDALVQHANLGEAANALIQLAMRGGAPDNVTCVVADVIQTESLPAADDTAEAFLVGAAPAEQAPRSEPHGRRGPGAAMRSLLGSSERTSHVDDADASEQLRYAPRPPRRFRWLRRLAVLAVVAALAWGGLVLADNYVRGQYYVGDHAVGHAFSPAYRAAWVPGAGLCGVAVTPEATPLPRRGRGTELALLLFAVGIATAAYVSVDLGAIGRVPPNAIAYLAGLCVITGVAHVVVRRWAAYADPV